MYTVRRDAGPTSRNQCYDYIGVIKVYSVFGGMGVARISASSQHLQISTERHIRRLSKYDGEGACFC